MWSSKRSSIRSDYLVLGVIIYLQTTLVNGKPLMDGSLHFVANAMDIVCTSTISLHSMVKYQNPDINKMYFRHMTPFKNFSVPLKEASGLRKDPLFIRHKKTVILATGWLNNVNNSHALANMAKAFFCRNDVNFLFVDVACYMDTTYKWAAMNTEEVGKFLAIGLKNLIEFVPLENIHLIGHSLGAHIMGVAGRYFTKITNGLQIPRITGLDPAKPCFGNENKLGSLGKGDAKLVDIIHTNPGILGIKEPIGNIDFYPGGITSLQPGCKKIDCSHSRAVEYFIESIYPLHESDFPAYKCRTWKELITLRCSKQSSNLYMGYELVNVKFGIFYVKIKKRPPYGKSFFAKLLCHQ